MLLLDPHGFLLIKTSLDIGQSNEYYECRIANSCIVDIDVNLEFYMSKSHRWFLSNWSYLICDNISRLHSHRAIPDDAIVFAFFYDYTLGSIAKIGRKLAKIVSIKTRWLYLSSLFIILRTIFGFAMKFLELPRDVNYNLFFEGSSKVTWAGQPSIKICLIWL